MITTKTGDSGETALMYGRRVPKTHPRVVACGEIDELNAAIGLARAHAGAGRVQTELAARQRQLVALMGELATVPEDAERHARDGFARLGTEEIEAFTAETLALEREMQTKFTDWAMPGEDTTPCGAALDLARAVARRAERAVVALDLPDTRPVVFLNRLSDWLWLLSRWEAKHHAATSPNSTCTGPAAA